MARRRGILGTLVRVAALAVGALALVVVGLLLLWSVAPPVSTLMLARTLEGRPYVRDYVPLRDISPILVASVIASEDARFCRNDGVDWDALHEVMAEADADGPSRGASTITMQTAKNLFLWPGRSVVRKAIEIPLALLLGKVWSKGHVLEVYFNIAEWGDDLFGVEAAAQRYFHTSARRLDANEAALLATSLPNPIERDAAHPRPFQRRLAASIRARARASGEWLACLPRR